MPGPIISAIASLVVPGLGQLLNKKYIRGIVLIVLWLLSIAIAGVAAIGLFVVIHLIFMIATAFDIYRIVKSDSTSEEMV
jgi:TM2 domain-containing membrane protein YozV